MEFLRAIDTALALIRRQPEAFTKVLGEVRRITVRRFPYALFSIHDHEVQAIRVLRCLHQHRDPRTWPQ
jgi:plasmid stabilization system protein ParE